MKLHSSAIEEIVRLCENYAGYSNQARLKEELLRLDFEQYERQTGEKILVTSKELNRQLRGY